MSWALWKSLYRLARANRKLNRQIQRLIVDLYAANNDLAYAQEVLSIQYGIDDVFNESSDGLEP